MTSNPMLHVLLVEDSDEDLELIRRELQGHKLAAAIDVVRDGAEAVDYLLRRGDHAARPSDIEPDIMILDLKLPKLDGLEVLRRVRRRPGFEDMPVIILTSSFRDDDIVAGYGLGAATYLVKPVEAEKFAETVNCIAEALRQVGGRDPEPSH